MATFRLLSGHEMPQMGFGTARLFEEKGKEAVKTALRCGIRQVDCAKVYGNEALVGNALREFLEETPSVNREDVFITSKIWNDDKHPENVLAACKRSLKLLQLDYLDLYLIHWPMQWKKGTLASKDSSFTLEDTWRELESLVDKGLVRSIGVSNFDITTLTPLLKFAKIPPSVNQIELHPLLQQQKMLDFCNEKGIVLTAWSPLAKFSKEVLQHPILVELAEKHEAFCVECILAWHLARGVAVIPRSSSPAHIKSNLESIQLAEKFDESDMEAMATINKDKRLVGDYVGIFDDTNYMPWGVIGSILSGASTALWWLLPNKVDLPYSIFKYVNPKVLESPNKLPDK